MKIKNYQLVNFANHVDEVLNKKLPTTMYYAIDCSRRALNTFVDPYKEAYEKVKDNPEECNDLLNQEIEVSVQTLPKSILDTLDNEDKYDALTWHEYNVISFMIEE